MDEITHYNSALAVFGMFGVFSRIAYVYPVCVSMVHILLTAYRPLYATVSSFWNLYCMLGSQEEDILTIQCTVRFGILLL
jgi:hypothetical protein